MKALEYHRAVQNHTMRTNAIILRVLNSLVSTCKVINNSGLSKFNVHQWIAHKTDSTEHMLSLAFMTHGKFLQYGKMCSSI